MTTWGRARAAYLEDLLSRGRAPSTGVYTRSTLESFERFCRGQGAEGPRELTVSHLVAYRRQLIWTPTRRGGLARPSTVAGKLTVVRSFVRWLVARGHLLADPTRDLVIPQVPRALPRLLTPDEAALLLESPNPRTVYGLRDRALLELLYSTGLRREECLRLDLDDYDRALEVLRVRRTKNRQPRLVPVGPTLQAALELYLAQARPRLARLRPGETALFLSHQGRRLGVGRLGQLVAEAARAAGLPRVAPHALRHACATHLLAGGADIRHVQALLGHESLDSTQRYTHLQPLEVFAEHRRTHPRSRPGLGQETENPS